MLSELIQIRAENWAKIMQIKSGPKIAKMVQIAAENHWKLSWNDVKRPQFWKGAQIDAKKM